MIAHALENTLSDLSGREGTGFDEILNGQNMPVRPPRGAPEIAMPVMPATEIYRSHIAIAIHENNSLNVARLLRMYFPEGLSTQLWSGNALLHAVQRAPQGDTVILNQLIWHGAIVNSGGGIRALVFAKLRNDSWILRALSRNGETHIRGNNDAVIDAIEMIIQDHWPSAREMAQLFLLFPNVELRGARGHALLHAAENLADNESSSRMRHERTQIAHMIRSHIEIGLDQSSDSD